jgi:alginate O-acetyltransferase complex protein AlgJ
MKYRLLIAIPVLLLLSVALIVTLLPLRWASDNILFNLDIVRRCARAHSTNVVTGRDGWLFYISSPLSIVLPWPRHNAERICAFRDSLRANGIELIVVPVPNKEQVYPEKVSSFRPAVVCRQRRDLIDVLRKSGVHVVDMLPEYIGCKGTVAGLYDAYDNHWMDPAIVIAAHAIAETTRTVARLGDGALQCVIRDTIENHCADIERILTKGSWCDDSRLYPVKRSSVRLLDGSPLMDFPDARILIYGDSFIIQGIACSATIGAHISRILGETVRSYDGFKACSKGPHFFQTRKTALSREIKVFIWIFASRSLAEPISRSAD